MKYFARIDENNVVQQVIVAESSEWCEANLGGVWIETFMDQPGKTYAGIGYTYDPDTGDFLPPEVTQ